MMYTLCTLYRTDHPPSTLYRRYHVHEKMVNFMAAAAKEPPAFAAQLFANLFGSAGRN